MSLESNLKGVLGLFQLLVDYGKTFHFMDELEAALPDVGPTGRTAGFEPLLDTGPSGGAAPLPPRGPKRQRADRGQGGSHSDQVAAPANPPVPPRGMKLLEQVIFRFRA